MVRVLVALLGCLLLLGGCSSLAGTGDKGYVSGDGEVRVIDPADRGDPVDDLAGPSLTGQDLDVTDYRGEVVVVNTWWSGCGPCRTEMPMLAAASKDLAGDAQFLGINIRDASAEQGRAFMRSTGADYPSIYDPKGQAILAFSGKVSLIAIPSTVVLDQQGRIAAAINGDIPSQQTLLDIVDEVAGSTDG